MKATDVATGVFEAQFDKKMRGKILGDRSWVEVHVTAKAGTAHCSLYAFPLNAIGQKLMFGARDGVVDAVIAALWEETELALVAS